MKISKSKGFYSLSDCTNPDGSAVERICNSIPVHSGHRSQAHSRSPIIVRAGAIRNSESRADEADEIPIWRLSKRFQDPPVGSQAPA